VRCLFWIAAKIDSPFVNEIVQSIELYLGNKKARRD
jgi:hypothetical protein